MHKRFFGLLGLTVLSLGMLSSIAAAQQETICFGF